METSELEKLEALRDEASDKARQALAEAARFSNWPRPVPAVIMAMKSQLEATATGWRQVSEWAAQTIRSNIEKGLM